MKILNKPAPFNQKQLTYLKRTFDSWLNVLEGGKRGGKNVLNTYAFCIALETHPDKFHLIAGTDTSSARVNIGDCNGYGLQNYFANRFKVGKYEGKDCYYINTKVGEKVVFFAGGAKKGSENAIHGYSYGMAYVTEANLCCIEFLQEVMDRTIASSNRKIFHDLNPKGKNHWYYTDFLKYHEEQQNKDSTYGYNYGHTTLVDNYSLSDEQIRTVLKSYDKNSVYYKRDIKGQREEAEGLVFPYFANDCKPYLFKYQHLKEKMKEQGKRFSHLIIGVDFGDNGSKYSWHLTGFTNDWDYMWALDEGDMEKSNAIDATKFCKAFVRFYKRCIECYGYVEWIFCDSASNTLINTLRAYFYAEGLDGSIIAPVKKNELTDRPITVDSLLVTGRLKIEEHCKNLINALSELVWDEKKDIPKDENVNNINDDWDSFCYTFITHSGYIDLRR